MTQLGHRFYPSNTPMSLTWQNLSSLVMMYKDSSGTFFFPLQHGLSEHSISKILHMRFKKFYSKTTNVLWCLLLLLLVVVEMLSLLLLTVF